MVWKKTVATTGWGGREDGEDEEGGGWGGWGGGRMGSGRGQANFSGNLPTYFDRIPTN